MSFFDIPEEVKKKPRHRAPLFQAPPAIEEPTTGETPAAPRPVWTGDEKDAPEVMTLVRILQALKPIFSPQNEDPRPFTRCAWFTPCSDGHGYLVATNSWVLVSVRIPENVAEFLKNPEAIATIADLADLVAANGSAATGKTYAPTVAFGTYGWDNLPGERVFPDWVAKIPTTRLDQEWTAKFDPALACIIDGAVKGSLTALGKEPPAWPIVTRMLGDAQSNTTGRVFVLPDVLAILMPLVPKSETIPTKQAVLDFVKEAR